MIRTMFSIEGNIGSGKTTLINIIQKTFPQINVVKEPVENWQKVGKYNLLQKYYEDPNRWAFTFQINAILTRMQLTHHILSSNNSHTLYFSERSIKSDREIFAKLLRQLNIMSEMEYQIYKNMFDSLENLFQTPKIHKYIYLRTQPRKCIERIYLRGRQEKNTQVTLIMDETIKYFIG